MEDESIAITMKNRPVPILNVVAETPDPPQGDTTAKPIPAPNDKRTNVIASEAAAPADTAAQETPDIEGSIASRSADCRRVSAIFIPPERRQRPTNAQMPVKFPSGNARMSDS